MGEEATHERRARAEQRGKTAKGDGKRGKTNKGGTFTDAERDR